MTEIEINKLSNALVSALEDAVFQARENATLKRYLRQAIMTHGGRLMIDVNLGQAAKDCKQEIVCGNGELSF